MRHMNYPTKTPRGSSATLFPYPNAAHELQIKPQISSTDITQPTLPLNLKNGRLYITSRRPKASTFHSQAHHFPTFQSHRLAASMVATSPPAADATRIEYYATTRIEYFTFAPSGLGYCDITVGSGQEAPYNTLINIHYTARFSDGIIFGSSYKRGRPLTMRLGMGKVDFGYILVRDCNIPANATLTYDINFVDIYKGNRK